MSKSKPIQIIESADPRWKDLYQLGGVAFIVLAFSTVFAIVAFFIWPYEPGFVPTADVFATLQEDRLRGLTPTQTAASTAAEEAEVRNLVENFGQRLQEVSLQASDAAQEMQKQYSEFVSPILLEMWMKNISKAPGRLVSSPWPDRIEITNLSKEGSDRYEITGFVVEVTSTEVVSGGAAAKIPVRIAVQREAGRWLITEYIEEQ